MCIEYLCVDGVIFESKSGTGIDCKHRNSDICDLCEVNLSYTDKISEEHPIIRW